MIYYRPAYITTNVGLCSSLTLLCIRLSYEQPEDYITDISTSLYNCKWSDLFIVSDTVPSTAQRRPIYSDEYPHPNNRVSYHPMDLIKWHDTWIKYIKLRPEITQQIQTLIQKYNICNSTCVYFRGTDKVDEFPRVKFETYDKYISPTGPIYVQSDEPQFVEYMKDKYPTRAYHIEEFNFSKGTPIHLTNGCTVKDAIDILCIVYLMAASKRIISNISNVVHCALIIRGTNHEYICVH